MPSLAFHLQNLEGNPGIFPVKEGLAHIQTDHWTIVKLISLEQIHNDLNYISSNFQQMCKLIDWNASYSQELTSMKIHTEFILDLTIEKYRQLVPQKRSKRGLINPLGSIIKLITGNLDHDDAVRYEELISKLNHNQIITSKKLTIVSKMFQSFINVTETINQNTAYFHNRLTKIELLLKDLSAKQNNWIFLTYLTGLFSVFTSSFRTIFARLSELETALALSKLSILHQSIVNSTELLHHLQLISNSGNLMYPPIETNLLKIEETICVKSFIKNNQITFIMEIPLTDNSSYNYFKIYSLPIFHESENKTLAIIPKYPYLLAKGMKYLPLIKPCRPLSAGDQFLCTADNQALYYELTCVEQLMKFEYDHSPCKQREIEIEKVRVQQVNAASWLLYTRLRTTLTKQCGEEISKQLVFGTYLVTIDEPCVLQIYGIHLRRHIFVELEVVERIPIVTLSQLNLNATASESSVVNMKGISLDEVKYMAFSLKHSEVIESVLNENKNFNFSEILGYVTLGLVIFSFITFLIYITWLKSPKCLLYWQNCRKDSQIEPSDNFALRVGGVIDTPHPSALD